MGLKPSLMDVLARLEAEGSLSPEASARARPALDTWWGKHGATPWYVRVLVGAGAWVAAVFLGLFFGLFLSLLDLDHELMFAVLGLLVTGASLWLRRLGSHDFLTQLTLAMGLAGQGLFVGGVAASARSEVGAAVALLLIGVPLLAFHPDRTQRFLSTVGATGALLYLLYEGGKWIAVDVGMVGLAAGIHAVLLHQARLQRGGREDFPGPLLFGLVCTFFGALLTRAATGASPWRDVSALLPSVLLTLGLAAVTLYSALRILKERGVEPGGPVGVTVFVSLGLTALLTLHTPGVIAAAGVLALAFHRRNVVLLGLAVAFLLTFGVYYYYDLALSLLAKSLALLGGGLGLLGLRLFILRRLPVAVAPEVR